MQKNHGRVHLDFETYSDVDIRKVGAYNYARHPSTRVLFASYAKNDGKIYRWDTSKKQEIPVKLYKLLTDPNIHIHAFNANFERLILKYVLKINLPIEKFRCTMIHAYGLSFAGSMDNVGEQIGLPLFLRKDKRGKDLIRKFCQPQPASRKVSHWNHINAPEEWEMLGEYCDQDVEAERAIYKFLEKYPLRQEEWDGWFLDQRINDRGLPIDRKLLNKALILAEKEKERLMKAMKRITKLDNPNSGPQLHSWLEEKNFQLPNLQKATVTEALEGKIPGKSIRRVLEIKAQLAKSSVSKYEALNKAACSDDRLYGSLQYMGAQRTARWAGRLFQPHNLPRPEMNGDEAVNLILTEEHPKKAMTVLSSAIRGAICAEEGKQLTVSDLAGIEGRVLPWLCYFQEKVDKIAAGLSMYKVAAAGIYHMDYDAIDKESIEYLVGKITELALGYQGALGALNSMAKAYGLPEYTPEVGYPIVRGWRDVNKPIVNFWSDCEKAIRLAILNPGMGYKAGRIEVFVENDFLFAELPSGRCLSYYKPKIVDGSITYMGLNTYTRKWERIQSYGGKFAENFAQAVSRDILIYLMFGIERYGFPIVGTVHDEVINETKKFKKYNHEQLTKLMTVSIPWAQDLPLGAKSYTAKRFKK